MDITLIISLLIVPTSAFDRRSTVFFMQKLKNLLPTEKEKNLKSKQTCLRDDIRAPGAFSYSKAS
jgi:hypothetical protein